MSTYMLLIHALAVLVVVALVVICLVVLVKEKRAHAADVERLEAEVEALRHQNAAWQKQSHDL
ncbi:MAG: hypothetical protein Q4B10_03925 [Actinomycetaceae bacterium]|nr:hypothetical protein [Actinomycetaceae bacterium]